MLIYNEFKVLQCFTSEAGPIWVCKQIYDRHENCADRNPAIAFWRNDMLRKPQPRGGLYFACWVDQGYNPKHFYLFLFAKGYVPWIGTYKAMEHTRDFSVLFAPNVNGNSQFDPDLARQAQAELAEYRQMDLLRDVQSFIKEYGDNVILKKWR